MLDALRSWESPITFSSPLGPASWVALLGVPVGILLLYFLKLRRRPVQVPSTLLWRRSLEDLHVNSLFQRLRKNLLLFLQLLFVAMLLLALLGPRVKGTTGRGQRFILAIDNSASMSATDVSPSRLEQAKQESLKVIDQLGADDLAMVLTFNDRAQVFASYTANKQLLRERIRAIQPSESTTSLRDALVVAAGLANPATDLAARNMPRGTVITGENESARLYVFTDGGFADVENFSLGNLQPEFVIVGAGATSSGGEPPPGEPENSAEKKSEAGRPAKTPPSDNVAILALQTARNDEHPDQFQVFGRVHNYRAEPVETEARLYRHESSQGDDAGSLIDAINLKLPPQSDQAFKFDLPDSGRERLEVRIDVKDALALDNRAFTTVGIPRKAQVLFVSRGDRYLAGTLKTPSAAQLADVVEVTPEDASTKEVVRDIDSGRYDLVIYDRYRPTSPPAANTLYFGALPPGAAFDQPKDVEGPVILDWDIGHPLMQYIRDLRLVRVVRASVVEPPSGSTDLISSNQGPLAFVTPRQGFSDAVVCFGLFYQPEGEGKDPELNTDWPIRFYSFPLFIFNALRVLGNARETGGEEVHLPGQPVVLRADSIQEKVEVNGPGLARTQALTRSPQGTFVFNDADRAGLYQARWGREDEGTDFAVNLFDPRESDLAPRGNGIQIGNIQVSQVTRRAPARLEYWWPLAWLALGLVLFEWYVYNKRVYI
ncbi:MAG: BatA and WFA domain-containing protein [Isosphaeraceae bacterium]